MDYEATVLNNALVIDEIISIHYFEFHKNYYFPGEKHFFWEFLFVDTGEIEVIAGSTRLHIKKGEIIFHKPNEFHNLWANGKVAPNVIVVSFTCNAPSMSFFSNKLLTLNENEKSLLAKVINEARRVFSSPLDDSDTKKLIKKETIPFAGEQIIKMSLELLLIELITRHSLESSTTENVLIPDKAKRNELVDKIIAYLKENLADNITVDALCNHFYIGHSYIHRLFRNEMGMGVVEYHCRLKIEAAKTMIREENYNITQISEKLGFSSIHYFSRCFKKITGVSPSAYASSIKSMLRDQNSL